MTDDELRELMRQAAASLGEHVAAVQIHVSWPAEGGGTNAFHVGTGDWYARQGLAHQFISMDRAQEIGESVASKLEP